MQLFSIAPFQFKPQERSIQGNLDFIVDRLSNLQYALVVLPELFLGSHYSIEPLPSQELASILNELISLSTNNALALVGSLPVLEKNKLYNRAIAIANGKLYSIYDKKKLFRHEQDIFIRGQFEPSYFTFVNFRVSCQICLDVLDPLVTKRLACQGVEILCVPASFSISLLPKIIQARSLENQIITLFANRCGIEDNGIQYRGESSIFLPTGEFYSLDNREEEVKVFPIDTYIVESMRETRKVLEVVELS